MNIRRAVSTDNSLLSTLCMEVQSLHAEHHPDLFKRPDNEDFAVLFFDQMLSDSMIFIYIAEEAGGAVGYILCKIIERPENPFTFSSRYLLVDQISVRPGSRGRGIGTALIEQAETLARELSMDKVQLDSWDFNIKAHSFFERMGYQKFNFRFWRNL
ncbi:MAG: GNAT family N-acetyltransferase [Chloroflexota bacterium]